MRQRGGGRIVPGVPYAAAKGGSDRSHPLPGRDVGPLGIIVNAIAPGTVLSGKRMIALWSELMAEQQQQQQLLNENPLGRLSTAEELGDMVVFLTGPASRYVSGAVRDVNGGRLLG